MCIRDRDWKFLWMRMKKTVLMMQLLQLLLGRELRQVQYILCLLYTSQIDSVKVNGIALKDTDYVCTATAGQKGAGKVGENQDKPSWTLRLFVAAFRVKLVWKVPRLGSPSAQNKACWRGLIKVNTSPLGIK